MTPSELDNEPMATRRKSKGRHDGQARTWTISHGLPPHTLYARELGRGGIIQVRFTDPTKPGRDKRVRKHFEMRVRRAPDADVDPKLEKKVQSQLITANARLIAGLPPFDEPALAVPVDRSANPPTQETLTLVEGFELALDEATGKYASTKTRRYRDMLAIRDILFTPTMLDPNLTWTGLRYTHVVALWRRMAAIHLKEPERFGPRRAEVIIDAVYAVASWLRKREHIASNAAVPVRGWRTELVEEWEEKTGKPVQVKAPRHSVDEARTIFAALWNPVRLRYRELIRVTAGGGQRALATATRENVVRDHAGRPIALRLRALREHRDGTTESVSVRVPLDDRARRALAAVDTPEAAAHAPLFDAPVQVLEVDPRVELAVELGAEMRLGQVGEARRSQLDLARSPTAPHGTFTVYGKKKKSGEKIALNEEQRVAVDHALETMLAEAEALYDPANQRTDYYLLPSGKLVRGAANVERARRAPITRDALRKAFHALEVAAGLVPVQGRGWYGLRRISTDAAPHYTSDSRVLDKLGGWAPGSTTRTRIYQDGENELVIADAAVVRQAWRTGAKMAGTGIPTSSETLLSQLPESLRSAVLAHFGLSLALNAVGTGVGTNGNGSEP